MTSIIWYIYNESLNKRAGNVGKQQETKAKQRLERIKNIGKDQVLFRKIKE